MMARTAAIELFSHNINISNKEVADAIGVSAPTLRYWLSNSEFVEKIYNRYMEVSGIEIPAVVQAMIEEAKRGNVQAGRLILEHFGKLENRLTIQVESNFEKFMKVDDTEDAEFFDLTNEQENTFDLISKTLGTDSIQLPKRDISNNAPTTREIKERSNIKKSTKKVYKRKDSKISQRSRYKIRKRAEKVGLALLSPGRHTRTERDIWMKKLEELEKEQK